jgi:3',5'-cyclic-AMP phosphodiesterase
MLTIAQITDLHITSGADPARKAHNEARLLEVFKSIHALKPQPIAIIASGDLVDRGDVAEYAELKRVLGASEIPIRLGIGNHDLRANFREAFPETPTDENGFVQYAADVAGIRLVMCDTVETGWEGASFCERRAAWLSGTLAKEPRTPTIVAFHHPPVASGIRWMDPEPEAEWIGRFAASLEGCSQVIALICGHVHRAFHGVFAGHLLAASAATAPQLTLNMTEVDRRVPDGREIVRNEPPGFSLYRWDGAALTAHSCVAGEFAPVAFFDNPFAD